jgi:hypothetical protein
MADPADALMHDAIEAALWQDLADALNRLQDYGLDPTAGEISTTVVDAGDVIHGGGVRAGGYLLSWTGSEWAVTSRSGEAGRDE